MINLDWQTIERYIDRLAAKIVKSGYKPDAIVGVALGGLVPTVLLAKALEIREVTTITTRSYEGTKQGALEIVSTPKIDLAGKNVLLVDDLIDSGATLELMKKLLHDDYRAQEVRTAVLLSNSQTGILKPDFASDSKPDGWIVFPWEKKEFPQK